MVTFIHFGGLFHSLDTPIKTKQMGMHRHDSTHIRVVCVLLLLCVGLVQPFPATLIRFRHPASSSLWTGCEKPTETAFVYGKRTPTTATKIWGSPSSGPKQDPSYDQSVELGSKEYLRGMVSRPVDADAAERVSGDKVLGPTLRLAGGVTSVLTALVLAFLISNGILSF